MIRLFHLFSDLNVFFLPDPNVVAMKKPFVHIALCHNSSEEEKGAATLSTTTTSLMTLRAGNTKGGSITVPLTSCLTGLEESVLRIKTKIASCHTADSKPVKQEVNSTVILPPLVFPASGNYTSLKIFNITTASIAMKSISTQH